MVMAELVILMSPARAPQSPSEWTPPSLVPGHPVSAGLSISCSALVSVFETSETESTWPSLDVAVRHVILYPNPGSTYFSWGDSFSHQLHLLSSVKVSVF